MIVWFFNTCHIWYLHTCSFQLWSNVDGQVFFLRNALHNIMTWAIVLYFPFVKEENDHFLFQLVYALPPWWMWLTPRYECIRLIPGGGALSPGMIHECTTYPCSLLPRVHVPSLLEVIVPSPLVCIICSLPGMYVSRPLGCMCPAPWGVCPAPWDEWLVLMMTSCCTYHYMIVPILFAL